MSEIELVIRPFMMGDDKDAALKVLEEAAEAYNEWAIYYDAIALTEGETEPYPDYIIEHDFVRFADEIADCIQACCNLAARYGVDLQAAMGRCEQRNRERGRYEASRVMELSEAARRVFDRLMDDSAGKAGDAE